MRRFRLAALLGGLLLAGALPAAGCSCGMRPPCAAFQTRGPVFLGKVLTVRVGERQMENFVARRRFFRIEVTESLVGDERVGDVVTVETGMGGGDCGYQFVIGQRYLVEAYVSEGRLETGICSATQPEEGATALLREIRTLKTGGRLPALTGSVTSGGWEHGPVRPLAGVAVKLAGPGGTVLRTRTDAEGIYSWMGLAPGVYTLATELPANLTTRALEEKRVTEVTIPESSSAGQACHEDVRALPGGQISGRVEIGQGRREIAFISARSATSGADGVTGAGNTQVDAEGKFTLRYLAPGDYVLEFATGSGYRDRWFYPGVRLESEAQRVHVGDGEKVEGIKMLVRPQSAD